MTGRGWRASKEFFGLGYWHSLWLLRCSDAQDVCRGCCFTRFRLGGKSQVRLFWNFWFVVLIAGDGSGCFFTSIHFSSHNLLSMQWLGLDNELKHLVVETTPNQVNTKLFVSKGGVCSSMAIYVCIYIQFKNSLLKIDSMCVCSRTRWSL